MLQIEAPGELLEITRDQDFYLIELKYNGAQATYRVPASLDYSKVSRLAVDALKALKAL